MNCLRTALIIPFILLLNLNVIADNYILVPVQFIVENGNFNQAVLTIKCKDSLANTVPGQRSMKLKLKYGFDYMLAFSKPGYITKTIHINTEVAADRSKYGFDPYKIGVRLFKQYEGVNIVVYNQPVAFIHYHPDLDNYGYDVDYTKSILSELSLAEEALSRKAAEERAMAKIEIPKNKKSYPDVEPIKSSNKNKIADTNSAVKNNNQQDSIPINPNLNLAQEKIINVYSSDDDKLKTAVFNEGFDERKLTNPNEGIDEPPNSFNNFDKEIPKNKVTLTNGNEQPNNLLIKEKGKEFMPQKILSEKISKKTVENYSEKGKQITCIKIKEGDNISSYKRVVYSWGAIFYFKDDTYPISEHTFNELMKN